MVIVFANNVSMAAESGTTSTFTTDPTPMGGNDSLTAIANVAYIFGGTSQSLSISLEGSNDGQNWTNIDTYDAISAEGVHKLDIDSTAVAAYAFVRMKMALAATGGDVFAGFDIHANLFHT